MVALSSGTVNEPYICASMESDVLSVLLVADARCVSTEREKFGVGYVTDKEYVCTIKENHCATFVVAVKRATTVGVVRGDKANIKAFAMFAL